MASSTASVIQVKRQDGNLATPNSVARSPTSLEYGELACASNGDLYCGDRNKSAVGVVTTNGGKTISGTMTFSSAVSMSSNLTVSGVTTLNGLSYINNVLRISPGGNNNWTEGIRIAKADDGWTTLLMGCSSSLLQGTADSVWSLHTNPDGNFLICHNGSGSANGLFLSKADANAYYKNYLLLHSGNYNSYCLPLSGGQVNGFSRFVGGITVNRNGCANNGYWGEENSVIEVRTTDGSYPSICFHRSGYDHVVLSEVSGNIYFGSTGGATDRNILAGRVYGAVYNDYAEYRNSSEEEPGRVVLEDSTGTCQRINSRLSPFAGVISDTFGFSQGETEDAKIPLAVAGRVLVYPYRNKYDYKIGDCVCAAPNGTVDIMTREEIREWPDRIVGTVSEIPEYEEWGTGKVKVNGRIWIKVK